MTDRRRRRRLGALAIGVAMILAIAIGVVDRPGAPVGSSARTAVVDDAEGGGPLDGPVEADGAEGATPYADLPAGEGLPWANAVQVDKDAILLPEKSVGGYGLADYHSENTNVTGGIRRSSAPPDCDCPELAVWFVGGSAAFGTGQRDDHTIASGLVREAAARGIRLTATNLGVPGYTLWQEDQVVTARLADPATPRPDLVVFYDGFNDAVVSFAQAVGGSLDLSVPASYDAADPFDVVSAGTIDRQLDRFGGADGFGRLAADRYRRLRDLIGRRMVGSGIVTRFVLQPDALASREQRDGAERGASVLRPDQISRFGAVLSAIEPEVAVGQIDLRHATDGGSPVYFDLVHTNDAGADRVAARLYDALSPDVERLARR